MSVATELDVLGDLAARAVASSENREEWLRERRAGVTATEAAKLNGGGAAARRALVEAKVSGEHEDLSGNRYVARGNEREPIIAAWIAVHYPGIEHNDILFHAQGDSRHLATPDGVGVFEGRFVMAEIKTSKHDLDPTNKRGKFWGTGYYDQVQWQLHVSGAEACLFVWEQHDDNWPNPLPLSLEPCTHWFERDEERIARLVELADLALVALDAAIEAGPAEPDVDEELDDLAAQVLFGREAEAAGKRAKEQAWGSLQARLAEGGVELSQRSARAQVSWTPGTTTEVEAPDIEAAKRADPTLFAEVQALAERWNAHAKKFTKTETKTTAGKLTVTSVKEKGE